MVSVNMAFCCSCGNTTKFVMMACVCLIAVYPIILISSDVTWVTRLFGISHRPYDNNLILVNSSTSVPNSSTSVPKLTSNSTKTVQGTPNKDKVILFWSTRYQQKTWFGFKERDLGRTQFQSRFCKHKNCILSSDRSKFREADVLLFYFADRFKLPPKRYPHQFYAHLVHEAPGRFQKGKLTYINKYEGIINVTINFRKDADLYIPYSRYIPVRNASMKTYKSKIPFVRKTKMALWPVGNCKPPSKRNEYVTELSKYISVDIYGGCGPFKCPRSRGKECFKEWENKYKFYISFENNICDDYITEKMYTPLEYDMIPVVLGGGNYTRDAPPHSVINARDFNTPKDLADFLIKLGQDEERYQRYFTWKPHYERVGGVVDLFCQLCEALHENKFQERPASTHYAEYWFGPNGERCDNDLVPRMRRTGGW